MEDIDFNLSIFFFLFALFFSGLTIAFNFGIVLKEGNIDMRRLAFRVIVDFFGSLSFVDLFNLIDIFNLFGKSLIISSSSLSNKSIFL